MSPTEMGCTTAATWALALTFALAGAVVGALAAAWWTERRLERHRWKEETRANLRRLRVVDWTPDDVRLLDPEEVARG